MTRDLFDDPDFKDFLREYFMNEVENERNKAMDEINQDYLAHRERFKAAMEALKVSPELTFQRRYELTQALGLLMSDASEQFAFAGWLGDWAYVIHEAFEKGDTGFLNDKILAALKATYELLGHWADFDDYVKGHGFVYIPYVPDNEADS